MIEIEIVYALPNQTTLLTLQVAPNSTVQEALDASGIAQQCHIELSQHAVGIYGRLVERETALKAGDRIEIYRPLINDPKTIRRQRAKK